MFILENGYAVEAVAEIPNIRMKKLRYDKKVRNSHCVIFKTFFSHSEAAIPLGTLQLREP